MARDRDQASRVLLGIGGIACVVMLYSLYTLVTGPKPQATQAQIDAAFHNGGASLPARAGY